MHRAQASEDVAPAAASTGDVGLDAATSFEQLCLPAALLRGLQRAGYQAPSPVQRAAIPLGRAGADLIVQAKSGTGKTCMFAAVLLPTLNLADSSPQALVVAPTREIAVQIRDVLTALGHFYSGLVVQAFIGGVPIASDRAVLRHTCHIAVGTPGRLLTLLREHYLPAQCLRRVVLDEVDQLLGAEREGNRGAMATMVLELLDMRSIVEPLKNAKNTATGGPASSTASAPSPLLASSSPPVPLHSQTIACSATLSDALHSELMRRMRPNTKSVLLCPDTPSLKGVRQFYVDISSSSSSESDSVLLPTGQKDSNAAFKTDAAIAAERYAAFAAKVELLLGALARIPFQQCVVFSNNRTRAAELVELLQSAGWPARCVAGDMSQSERLSVMRALHTNACRILVSTDLIARGIDVQRVSLVVNLDLPHDAATYLHRVGRTGRFGAVGLAISLVDAAERRRLTDDFAVSFRTRIESLPAELPAEYFLRMTSAEADDEPAESNGVVSATEPIDAAFRGVPDVRAAALANAGSVAIESGPKSSTSISSFVPKPVQSMSEQTAGLLERLKLPKTESENASSSSRIESKSHSDQQKSHGYRSSADASSSFVIDSVPAITRVNAAGQRLYCLCNEPYDDSNAAAELGQAERPAVCCVSCEDWFHLDCIGAASFDDVAIVNEAGDYEYECEFCARDGSDIFDASTDDGDDETDKSDRRQPTAGNPWGFCVDGAWMGADGMWCDERGSYDADGYFHPYATADVRAAAMRHRAEQVLISQQPQQQPQEQLQHRHDSQEQPYRSIAAAALSPSSAMQSPQHWLPPVFATADEFDPLALRRRALECARAHRRVLTGGEQLNR